MKVSCELRKIAYDQALRIEAYWFQGVRQEFPMHFHEHYVIGFMEEGRRSLLCNGQRFEIGKGDLILFNPFDNHSCICGNGEMMDYRGLNIKPEIMEETVLEIYGESFRPHFSTCFSPGDELISQIRELHLMILDKSAMFRKEEIFLLLMDQIVGEYSEKKSNTAERTESEGVRAACEHMNRSYAEHISLDDLSRIAGMSKFHLIRTFTRQKGISPYSYLETVRISIAKRMLESGAAQSEVALSTGFADQSHFSNFFKKLIGLTPKQYADIFKDAGNDKGDDSDEY